MDENKLVNVMMEVFTFLEDKDIYHPENIHVLECLLSWLKFGAEKIRIEEFVPK